MVFACEFGDDGHGMKSDECGFPDRSAIEEMWRQVVLGAVSREIAHDWVAPWIEDDDPQRFWPADEMVEAGLMYLHGLDMTQDTDRSNVIGHGGPGLYVLSESEVAERLSHWLEMCREYDTDPVGFRRRAMQRAWETPEYQGSANHRRSGAATGRPRATHTNP
ncbi:hypothetical protein [Nocardia sp. NPDC057668]|uniref:hypothetical protein n=1 Tax=Nocardia sp. NPDC057668 TaxID=3346202 RepID=UPI00366E8CB7